MYTLPESLTTRNVKSVQEGLIRFLEFKLEEREEKKQEAALDLIRLRDLDTAGLQLLLSAAINFRQKGLLVKIINLQPHLIELLQLSGAADILATE